MPPPEPPAGRPTLRKDAQRNRDRILATARDVFREHGASAPVEEIAGRAGVGMGTLYRHFPTKGALIDAIAVVRFTEMTVAADAATAKDDPAEGLTDLLRAVVDLQIVDRGFRDALSAGDTWSGPATEPLRRQLRAQLADLLRRAQEQGEVRGDVDVDDLLALVWGTGRVVEKAAPDAAARLAHRSLALQLDGLRTPTPSTLTD